MHPKGKQLWCIPLAVGFLWIFRTFLEQLVYETLIEKCLGFGHLLYLTKSLSKSFLQISLIFKLFSGCFAGDVKNISSVLETLKEKI